MGDGKKVYDSEGVDQALTNLQTKGCTTSIQLAGKLSDDNELERGCLLS